MSDENTIDSDLLHQLDRQARTRSMDRIEKVRSHSLVTHREHTFDMVVCGLLCMVCGFVAGVIYMGVLR